MKGKGEIELLDNPGSKVEMYAVFNYEYTPAEDGQAAGVYVELTGLTAENSETGERDVIVISPYMGHTFVKIIEDYIAKTYDFTQHA